MLKWLCMIAIPAICTAVTQLGQIFGWTDAGIISEVGVIICTLLGTLLGISNYQYHKASTESLEIGEDENVFTEHEDKGVM